MQTPRLSGACITNTGMECRAAHPRGKEMAVDMACKLLNYCGQVSLASAAGHRFLSRTGMGKVSPGQVKVTRNEHKVEKVALPSPIIRKMSFQNYDQQRCSRGSWRAVDAPRHSLVLTVKPGDCGSTWATPQENAGDSAVPTARERVF